jgi:hypothetical protein
MAQTPLLGTSQHSITPTTHYSIASVLAGRGRFVIANQSIALSVLAMTREASWASLRAFRTTLARNAILELLVTPCNSL